MELHISQFKMKEVVFQVKFRESFYLFDRTGRIIEELRKIWPNIKVNSAEPKTSTFLVGNEYLLRIELDRATIVAYDPKPSLDEFIQSAHSFEEIVRIALEYNEYKRVGFKPLYLKDYPDNDAATKDIVSSLGLKVPEGKHFNIEGTVPYITIESKWEDEFTGIRSELRSQERKWEVIPPMGSEGIEPKKIISTGIKYSPDYYTIKPVSTGKLNVKKWIETAFHLIKRDSKAFLEK
jgi:hypothetical protein